MEVYSWSCDQDPSFHIMYNFENKKWRDLVITEDCLSAAWSPDKRYIALSCINGYVGEIYVFDTDSDSLFQITNCLVNDNSCSSPAWSPDGQWLSYFQNVEKSGVHPRGIRMLNTSCLKDNDCINIQTSLIESDSNAVWSLKNELLLSHNGVIQFMEMKKGEFVSNKQINTNIESFMYISLSPDEEYLIFTSGFDALTLYSRSHDTFKTIFESINSIEIIGWIVIK